MEEVSHWVKEMPSGTEKDGSVLALLFTVCGSAVFEPSNMVICIDVCVIPMLFRFGDSNF